MVNKHRITHQSLLRSGMKDKSTFVKKDEEETMEENCYTKKEFLFLD